VSIENAREFRNNGADFLGVGGKLVNKQLVAENRFDEISDYARKLVELARLSA
jgi:2-keto-3-deoxy-6-phosphogluconate aldolase